MDDLNSILDDMQKLSEACHNMESKNIYVGIIGSAGSEVVKIAHAHEYGDGKLPERSFIRASFDADQAKLDDIVTGEVMKVLDGKTSADAAANSIGAQSAQLVQNFIDSNRVKPQSDFTKKTQHTTLYETGTHIRDRIAYEVVNT
ncbi:MAG: hypothetical protein IJ711_00190 [Lachnospiraceae bacterium]|nr:hypothetical protein [Clostridia bacterium]MBR1691174.1 hypothetical protein [Lachnospiraceae bacterium]